MNAVNNTAGLFSRPKDIVIVGGGDLAANRLLPALIGAGMEPKNIHVFALRPGSLEAGLADVSLHAYSGHDNDHGYMASGLFADARKLALAKGAPVIIASPSFAHLDYVKECLAAGLLVGCEKPLTCFPSEIGPFEAIINSEAGNRLFGFSYYALEKGLPLTWLKNPGMQIPRGLLEAVDEAGKPLDARSLSDIRAMLDTPVDKAGILLFEGGERSNTDAYRNWTLDPRFGGNPVETGVHPLLLACLAQLIKPQDLSRLKVTTGLFQGYAGGAPATFASYSGSVPAIAEHYTDIHLAFGKHIHKDNLFRGGSIVYANGMRVDFNFDAKAAQVSRNGRVKADIRVTKTQNYAAQVAQFFDFTGRGGWAGGNRGDFAAEQAEVLRQIMRFPATPHVVYGSEPMAQRAALESLNLAPQHAGRHVIASPQLVAEIDGRGGAITSLCRQGPETEFMGRWQGSQGMTAGFVMAPVVCSISESGKAAYRGRIFEPGKHGFARRTQFDCGEKSAGGLFLRHMHDPQATPGLFPFRHGIELDYAVHANELTARLSIFNLDERIMYFGAGFHPAFKWPLPGNASQASHSLTVPPRHLAGALIYRPADGKVRPDARASSPFDTDGVWRPAAEDFGKDGIFFVYADGPRDAGLVYKGEAGIPEMHIMMDGWDGFGIWNKPQDEGHEFLCIEPFAGLPIIERREEAPDLEDVQGLRILRPGGTFTAAMRILIP